MTAAERSAAFGRLGRLLADLRESGRRVPCQDIPDAWRLYLADDEDEQRMAGRLCVGCAALADCAEFIDAHPGEAGVYAGRTEADRKPRKGRPTTRGRAA